jgi:hypothetical protein
MGDSRAAMVASPLLPNSHPWRSQVEGVLALVERRWLWLGVGGTAARVVRTVPTPAPLTGAISEERRHGMHCGGGGCGRCPPPAAPASSAAP